MTHPSTRDRVIATIAEHLSTTYDNVPTTGRIRDLNSPYGVDPVELLLALEDEFGITLTAAEFAHATHVQDLIDIFGRTGPYARH